MAGLTNDERCLIHNLRVEKHWSSEIKFRKCFQTYEHDLWPRSGRLNVDVERSALMRQHGRGRVWWWSLAGAWWNPRLKQLDLWSTCGTRPGAAQNPWGPGHSTRPGPGTGPEGCRPGPTGYSMTGDRRGRLRWAVRHSVQSISRSISQSKHILSSAKCSYMYQIHASLHRQCYTGGVNFCMISEKTYSCNWNYLASSIAGDEKLQPLAYYFAHERNWTVSCWSLYLFLLTFDPKI